MSAVSVRNIVQPEVQRDILEWFEAVILPQSHADGTWDKFLEELEELEIARARRRAAELSDSAPALALALREENIEAADVFISFLAWCFAEGLHLNGSTVFKHAINRGRTWGPPDERGVRRHV